MKILVLGGNGMLGSMLSTVFAQHRAYSVEQTVRPSGMLHISDADCSTHLVDVQDQNAMWALFAKTKPDVVINCIGVIKQRPEAQKLLDIFPLNALFPHWLAETGQLLGFRVIHFSTDCVFSGNTGMYLDDARSDVDDYYGQSKYIGEIKNYSNALTLRTSIIGHETNSKLALVEWFLAQNGPIKGFTKAIFSGFPTVEIGNILANYVLKMPNLSGVYNISSNPISKYDLLLLVKEIYDKNIEIIPDDTVSIDRSLNSNALRGALGYTPPYWPELIKLMHSFSPNIMNKL